MSRPTAQDIKRLKAAEPDDEKYHVVFDRILETKLAELDDEWVREMQAIYDASNMSRWCA